MEKVICFDSKGKRCYLWQPRNNGRWYIHTDGKDSQIWECAVCDVDDAVRQAQSDGFTF